MSVQSPPRVSAIAWVYLAFSILGAVTTWRYNLLAAHELGGLPSPMAFLRVGFEGSALMGSLAADFWVGANASLIWMVVEARRLGMRRPWAYVVLALVVAWACALPLFLFMRERRLAAAPRLAEAGASS